jgi:hypothetical protein
LGILLGVSLTVMILLTVRIAVVEIPTISPIMAAHFRVPAPFQLATGAVLMVMLTTAVARRWSEPQWSGNATGIAVWRREEKRYYHERRSLILILGGVALAKCIEGAVALAEMWYGFFKQGSALVWTFWDSIGSFLTYPTGCLSLALILLVLHVAFSGRLKRTDALAMEQPRLSPGIFLIVWFSALTIIVCSAPILASWHFASFMRSGYIH